MSVLTEPTTIGRALEYSQRSKVAIRERMAEEQAERDQRLRVLGLTLPPGNRAMCRTLASYMRTRKDADLSAIADQLDLVAGR